MAQYRCNICGYIYDEDKEPIPYDLLWTCPLCKVQRTELVPVKGVTDEEIENNAANISFHENADVVLDD